MASQSAASDPQGILGLRYGRASFHEGPLEGLEPSEELLAGRGQLPPSSRSRDDTPQAAETRTLTLTESVVRKTGPAPAKQGTRAQLRPLLRV